MISPYERNGSWWFNFNGEEFGPFNTEDRAWEQLEVAMRASDCRNGSCDV